MSTTDLSSHGVVVVGASVAGTSAIAELRRQGYDGTIMLIGSEPHAPYARPPLSKGVLKGTDRIDELGLPPLDDEVDVRLGVEASALDLDARTVLTAEGDRVRFGGLVIATGARARTLEPPGGRAERVLRTVDDYHALRDALERGRSLLVIGGGFLGMEVASAARELGLEVSVVDLQQPLRAHLGGFLSDLITSEARELGVAIRLSPGGVSTRGREHVDGVELDDGTVAEADLVLTAVGCAPNVEWLQGSGLAVDGGVRVDERCRVAAGVVAAGDLTRVARSGALGPRTPNWMSAFDQGRLAARTLLEIEEPGPPAAPYFWTEAFGIELRIAGTLPVDGEPAFLEGDPGNLPGGPALVAWGPQGSPSTAVAINRKIAAPKLRRLVAEPS